MNSDPLMPPILDIDAVFKLENYLPFYLGWLTDAVSDAETALLVKLLELDAPKTILDLACGFGRHANRLAALGHQVTGLDFTEGYLELARQGARKLGVEADYRRGDMRRLEYSGQFDRILLMYTSFGYFEDAENERVAANVARALKPGGLAVFDLPNRDKTAGLPPSTIVHENNGDLMIDRMSFDMATGRSQNRRIIIRNGIRTDLPFCIRLYNATEIRDLLHKAGLEIHKLVDGDGLPLSSNSRRLLVIARKPAAE